jgi:hypothetical protein
MMKNCFVILLILVALVVSTGFGCSENKHSDGSQELLTETKESGIAGEIRRAGIDIRTVLNQLEAADEDSAIQISLFEDFSIHARLIGKTTVLPGVVSYRYQVEDPVPGMLIISVEDSKILANIDLSGLNKNFIIQPVHNTGEHVVIEIDPAKMDILDGGSPLSPEDF